MIAVYLLSAIGVVVALRSCRDAWDRSYALTIMSMYLGYSNVAEFASLGVVLKTVSVVLLGVVTAAKYGAGLRRPTQSVLRLALATIWVTAGLAIVTLAWSADPLSTALEGGTLLTFAFVLHQVSTKRWLDGAQVRADLSVAYRVSCCFIVLGVGMVFLGVDTAVDPLTGRWLGFVNNPNALGVLAVVTFGLGLSNRARRPWVNFGMLLILASQVVLSGSRTALLALCVGGAWAVVRGGGGRIISAILVASCWLAAAVILGWNVLSGTMDRMLSRPGGDLLNQRGFVWQEVLTMLSHAPAGVGWAATQSVLELRVAQGVSESGLISVHNSYLQLLLELGWLGSVPVLLLLALLLWIAIQVPVRGGGVGLVVAVVSGSLVLVTESVLFGMGQPFPYIFWLAVTAAAIECSVVGPVGAGRRGRTGRFSTTG